MLTTKIGLLTQISRQWKPRLPFFFAQGIDFKINLCYYVYMEFTIDCTPESLKTPEGVKKVNEALEVLDLTRVDFANEAVNFFQEHESTIRSAIGCYYLQGNLDGEETEIIRDELTNMLELIKDMKVKQEAFFQALGGR